MVASLQIFFPFDDPRTRDRQSLPCKGVTEILELVLSIATSADEQRQELSLC